MDAENIADIQLRFANGSLGNVHLDMLQRAPARFCKLIGTEGTLLWDGIAHCARIYLAENGRWEDLGSPVPTDRNHSYVEELRYFLDCVQNRRMPLVSGEDGLQVLKIALAIHESARRHREVHL